MRISYKGDYALKIILELAQRYDHGVIPIKEISKRQDIPEKFLEQIITLLKGANLVKTVRGKNGGVAIAKPPSLITLGEVIRLVEGYTSPISCVSTSAYSHCNFENRCAFRGVFDDRQWVSKHLARSRSRTLRGSAAPCPREHPSHRASCR